MLLQNCIKVFVRRLLLRLLVEPHAVGQFLLDRILGVEFKRLHDLVDSPICVICFQMVPHVKQSDSQKLNSLILSLNVLSVVLKIVVTTVNVAESCRNLIESI